jgi:nicotinate-nucleotide pyrophosphorylase (carboxylating)
MESSFDIEEFLVNALAEDVGEGDITSNAVIPRDATAKFAINARQKLVVAGLVHLPMLFGLLHSQIKVKLRVADGDMVEAGTTLATIEGPARALLMGERTALNLLQHLGGVATLTRDYVNAVAGTNAKVFDTRKTIPGLRDLQKYAVRCGGGYNHRMGLYDAVLIKDNHIAVAGGVTAVLKTVRSQVKADVKIEIECDTLEQLDEALTAGVDAVLLDNMDNATLREGVRRAKAAGVISEASGNVNLQTIRAIAETGVDHISVGKLTHSAVAVDIGLDEAQDFARR